MSTTVTSSEDGRLLRLLRTVNYLILFLICFFLVVLLVSVAERSMVPVGIERSTSFQIAEAASLDPAGLDPDQFEPLPQHWYSYRLPAPEKLYVLRTTFQAEDIDRTDYAAYITRARDRISVFLNGQPVGIEKRDGNYANVSFLGPRLYTLPDLNLQDGTNTLDIYIYGYTLSPRIYSTYIGPRDNVVAAYNARHILNVSVPIIVNSIGIFLAFFAIIVAAFSREQRHEYGTLGLITLFWVGRNIYYQVPMHTWSEQNQSLMFNITTFGLVMSIAAFANAWTARSVRTYKVLAVLALGYTAFSYMLDFFDPEYGNALYLYFGLVVVVCTLVWTGWRMISFRRQRHLPYISIAAFGICVSTAVVDALSEMLISSNVEWWPLETTMPYSPMAIVIVALGIIYVLAQTTLQLRRAEVQQREILATELAAREQELAASYEKTREQEKEAAILQERQRIMLDMHDGIGSQLLGLQLQIKQDNLPAEEVAKELQISLNDLRLIVDSLDTEIDDIAMALGAFRARVQPQLSAAGIALNWQMAIREQVSGFGPEAVLHIYRIMQEAVTNALRHAQGMTELTISMKLLEVSPGNTGNLQILIEDNGDGIDESVLTSRRGLSHIRKRADALNGSCEIGNTGNGTRVSLVVPVRDEGNA